MAFLKKTFATVKKQAPFVRASFFIAVALVMLVQPAAGAMSASERKNFAFQDTFFIDDPCPPLSQGGPSTLAGKDNVQKAYNYFVGGDRRLTPFQSAGIVGNLIQESGVNPKSDQRDGPGRGIAQWSEGGRWEALKLWAAGQVTTQGTDGRDPEALDTQLDYIWYEMNHVAPWNETLPALKATTTVEQATEVFEAKFEKAGIPLMEQRIEFAKQVLALYGSGATNSASGCGSGLLIGDYSFPLAPQTKRNYGYTLPCTKPKSNGPYTVNNVYTNQYNVSTTVSTCHHDATPAFDLSYGTKETGNQPIYAITSGKITRVNRNFIKTSQPWGIACNSINLHANTETDKSFYWYGHVLASVTDGQFVEAGEQIGTVAPYEPYGPKCWEGGVHLHIDRGCTNPNGNPPRDPDFPRSNETGPQPGGGKDCRDPAFVNDLQQIWEALPAE